MRIRRMMVWGFFFALFLAVSTRMGGNAQESGGAAKKTVNAQVNGSARQEGDIPEPTLYATAAALIDIDSGRLLYGKNADQPMPMASTTKIMTCIVILENVSIEETLTVSSYAAGMPKVKLYIKPGEQYTVKDLLYSLMLESHNDSAAALAEHVGKQYLPKELREKPTEEFTAEESKQAVAAFAGLMNQKAEKLGCVDTWFITPNGLDAVQEFTLQDGTAVQKEHCTTAAELARIMAYCVAQSPASEEFLEITRTPAYSFSANGRSFSCVNHNAFLNMMDGVLSGKTGFTNKAGYCYVAALERDERRYAVALLACGWPNNKTWKWSDTRELLQYGLDHYFYRSFSEEGVAFDGECLMPVRVLNGQTDTLGESVYVGVKIDSGDTATEEAPAQGLLMREDEKVWVRYWVEDVLKAPVAAGTEVGRIEYSVDGVVYRTERIVTAQGAEAINFGWCMREVLARYLIF